jgi:hypothetical protein
MTRTRVRWYLALIASVSVLATSCAAHPSPRRDSDPTLWVIQGGWLSHLLYSEPRIAKEFFLRDPSVVLGAIPGSHGHGITAFAYPSFRWFSRTYGRDHSFFRGFTSVLYDPEAWDATPLRERQHPARAIERFADLAHSGHRRLSVIVTPHYGLMNVPGADCTTGPNETAIDAFLRCDLIGVAARYGDVVEVQAQDLQANPDAYRSFVAAGADQARAANGNVKVISGLSARGDATPDQLFAALESVRDLVDGYYLSIQDNAHVDVALGFLRLVDADLSASFAASA